MGATQPIGIFDSGLGGVGVLEALQARLPEESFLYWADTQNLPYGGKTEEEIRSFTEQGVLSLLEKGAKCIVLACHTASCIALPFLKKTVPAPLFGMTDASSRALEKIPPQKRIAVLGTEATILSQFYQRLVQETLAPEDLFPLACPLLAPLIEHGSSDSIKEGVIKTLSPLKEKRPDVAFLACTHYPLAAKIISEVLEIPLIDPALFLAEHVAENIALLGLTAPGGIRGEVRFFATKDTAAFEKKARTLLYKKKIL